MYRLRVYTLLLLEKVVQSSSMISCSLPEWRNFKQTPNHQTNYCLRKDIVFVKLTKSSIVYFEKNIVSHSDIITKLLNGFLVSYRHLSFELV